MTERINQSSSILFPVSIIGSATYEGGLKVPHGIRLMYIVWPVLVVRISVRSFQVPSSLDVRSLSLSFSKKPESTLKFQQISVTPNEPPTFRL
jgi:hypothetical protein